MQLYGVNWRLNHHPEIKKHWFENEWLSLKFYYLISKLDSLEHYAPLQQVMGSHMHCIVTIWQFHDQTNSIQNMYNNLRIGHVLSNGTAKDLAITLSAPFLLFYHVINLLTLILEKKLTLHLTKRSWGVLWCWGNRNTFQPSLFLVHSGAEWRRRSDLPLT